MLDGDRFDFNQCSIQYAKWLLAFFKERIDTAENILKNNEVDYTPFGSMYMGSSMQISCDDLRVLLKMSAFPSNPYSNAFEDQIDERIDIIHALLKLPSGFNMFNNTISMSFYAIGARYNEYFAELLGGAYESDKLHSFEELEQVIRIFKANGAHVHFKSELASKTEGDFCTKESYCASSKGVR